MADADKIKELKEKYSSQRVVDLKSILKKRNLLVSGKKADLVKRLVDADAEEVKKRLEFTEEEETGDAAEAGDQQEEEANSKEEEPEEQGDEPKAEDAAKPEESAAAEEGSAQSPEKTDAKDEERTVGEKGDTVAATEENAGPRKRQRVETTQDAETQGESEDVLTAVLGDVKPAEEEKPEEPKQADATSKGEEPSKEGGSSSDEPQRTIRVDDFLRPFTLAAAKRLLEQFGPLDANGFWMNSIKTHCYATFVSKDAAAKAKKELDGMQWPPRFGRNLRVQYSSVTAQEVEANGEPDLNQKAAPKEEASRGPKVVVTTAEEPQEEEGANENVIVRRTIIDADAGTSRTVRESKTEQSEEAPRERRLPREETMPPPVTLDTLYKKTETTPHLYWLPLTDAQVDIKERRGRYPEDDMRGGGGGRFGGRGGGRFNGRRRSPFRRGRGRGRGRGFPRRSFGDRDGPRRSFGRPGWEHDDRGRRY